MNNKITKYLSYLLVGGATTLVSLGTFFILELLGFHYIVSTIISFVFAVIFAYFSNKYFVFKSREVSFKVISSEMYRFVIGRLSTLIIDLLGMVFLVEVLLLNRIASKLLLNVVILIINYLISEYYVFKTKEVFNE